MKARCVVEGISVEHETVGARGIGDDENYYERYVKVSFKPTEDGNDPRDMQEINSSDLSYVQDFSEGGGSPDYKISDSDIIKEVKRKYDIGDIVNIEFRKEGACGIASNLGGIPMYVERTVMMGIELEKKKE